MKYVFVYYQHDLEEHDVYIRGVYSREEDAIQQMDRDIRSWSRLHNYNYETAKDSFDMPFDIAAECRHRLYLHERLDWIISVEELNEGGN